MVPKSCSHFQGATDLTFLPGLQNVTDGKSTFFTGFAVVLIVVKTCSVKKGENKKKCL